MSTINLNNESPSSPSPKKHQSGKNNAQKNFSSFFHASNSKSFSLENGSLNPFSLGNGGGGGGTTGSSFSSFAEASSFTRPSTNNKKVVSSKMPSSNKPLQSKKVPKASNLTDALNFFRDEEQSPVVERSGDKSGTNKPSASGNNKKNEDADSCTSTSSIRTSGARNSKRNYLDSNAKGIIGGIFGPRQCVTDCGPDDPSSFVVNAGYFGNATNNFSIETSAAFSLAVGRESESAILAFGRSSNITINGPAPTRWTAPTSKAPSSLGARAKKPGKRSTKKRGCAQVGKSLFESSQSYKLDDLAYENSKLVATLQNDLKAQDQQIARLQFQVTELQTKMKMKDRAISALNSMVLPCRGNHEIPAGPSGSVPTLVTTKRITRSMSRRR